MLSQSRLYLSIVLVLAVSGALLPSTARGTGLPSAGVGLQAEPPSAAGMPPGARLLWSTDQGVAFEVGVPWQQLSVEPVTAGGREYVRVSLPGWAATAQPGAPELPLLARAIGVPFGAALSVQVEPGPAHAVALPAPPLPVAAQPAAGRPGPATPPAPPSAIPSLPRPLFEVEQDPAVYGGEAPYPAALARIAGDGVLRQQRVAGIVATPVQYNPHTQELAVYESLRVQVTFGDSPAAVRPAPSAEPAAYEELLRTGLLNYDSARTWRQGVPAMGARSGDRAQLEGDRAQPEPWAPPVPGWRVKVREEGFYRLTYAELEAAELPVESLDPRTFQLFALGREVALEVDGEADGVFDPEDSVVFYGQPVASKYTRDGVYWLTHGQAPGLRMAARDGTPGTAQAPEYYVASRHLEQNVYYITALPGDEELERWVWGYVYPPGEPSWSASFSLTAPYTGTFTATLAVEMFGYLSYPQNPDHHTQVYLNGTLVEDAWWDGITWRTAQISLPQSLLAAGENTVSVVCPNDTGVGIDLVDVDWLELRYADTFEATGDELAFTHDVTGTWQYRVEGLSTDQVAAYDVTDPGAVVRFEGLEAIPSGPGYAVEFEDTPAGPARYRVVAEPAYRAVQAVEPDTPSDLRSPANGADYVVIAHQAFWEQAAALRDYRASQGLRAVLVDVQDAYDEFGYGLAAPSALRDLLAYAYDNWQAPAPWAVVLVGDGHYDPNDYLGYGRVSYVPPYLAPADPWIGETAADNRYVTLVGGDTLPDMVLGRLSVDSSAEASTVVSKTLAYEQGPAPGDWTRQVLAVADNADSAGNFAQMSENVLSCCLPHPYQAQRVYYKVTHQTVAQAREAIQAGINAGALLVNLVGHADMTMWAQEGLFTTADVPQLQNGDKLPVMLPMTCWDGYYFYPYPSEFGLDAMGEVVSRADGRGAVASWSPTGLGVATGHGTLDAGFFDAVFRDGLRTLGAATQAGKLELWASGSNLDLLDTYLLFGDPALRIAALDADVQVAKGVAPAGPLLPGAVLTYTLTFTNTGPAMAHQGVLTDVLPAQLTNPLVIYASPQVTGLIPGTAFAWTLRDLLPGESGQVRVRARVASATPPGEIANTAQIAAAEPDPQPGNNAATATIEVAKAMRVGAISVAYQQTQPGRYVVTAITRILDLTPLPVPGAAVTGQWTWPAGGVTTQQVVSDPQGRVRFRITTNKAGTYKLCVTQVVKAGWLYNPNRNIETCDTVTIP